MQAQATLLKDQTRLSTAHSAPALREVKVLPYCHKTELMVKSKKLELNSVEAQEIVCNFFLSLVKHQPSEVVLKEFNQLFINPAEAMNIEHYQALYQLALSKNEVAFKSTLQRCCYILINNWVTARSYQSTRDLIKLLSQVKPPHYLSTQIIKSIKNWVLSFVNSPEYEELKLFVAKYDNLVDKKHWKSRYTSYLLAPQYADTKKPVEQRQAARTLSTQLKEQFKIDLAMYTARSPGGSFCDRKVQNPTALGDEALRLVKKIVAKRGSFSYPSLAKIFLNQTQYLCYKDFKESLLKYLVFSEENKGIVETLKTRLGGNLEFLYEKYQEEALDRHLILKTCNRVIDCLTIERSEKPSQLFILLASQGNPLTLGVILAKIILISPQSRTHLEVGIAKLIQYYEDCPQEECQWVINFLEVLRIILTVYTENVQYNLVNMEEDDVAAQSVSESIYRIFSQTKRES